MFKKLQCKKHGHMGMMGMVVVSTVLTLPLIYYAMDIAHSLRSLAHDND